MTFKIIIAEDEDITRKHLIQALTREGYSAVGVKNGRKALDRIEREYFDLLITDIRMPEMSGMELLERVKEKHHGVEVLIITGFGTIDSAVDAMKKGACEYITKPFNLDELIIKIRNLHERVSLKRQNLALKTCFGMNKGVSLVSASDSMRRIMDIIEAIRDSDCAVVLTGEAGVGKRLLAKMIHFTSRRHNMPFFSLSCGGLAPRPFSEELFGYEEEGAEVRGKAGLFEIAHSGTIFLEDITEISHESQLRLLRAIRDNEVFRAGGKNPMKVDVRVIASTERDIKEEIQRRRFSRDLYYTLNTAEIYVPPLRERKEDIAPLAEHFLKKYRCEINRDISGFQEESMNILLDYSYPGNVRELENIIERAAIVERSPLITPDSLPRSIKMFRIQTFTPDRICTIDELTRDYAERVLQLAGGDKKKAALVLGIPVTELWRIMKGER